MAGGETELISRAQQGYRSAFSELVSRHYPVVIRVIHRMCGDVQSAEDAAQETFIKAWLNLATYNPRSPLRNWLCRIAINTTLDMMRKRTPATMDDEATLMIPDHLPGPEAVVIQNERITLLHQAIQHLPEATRSVLVLKEYGGLTYQEIATSLEIPLGTVMSRLNYARTRLKDCLQVQLLAEVGNG